MKEQAQVDSPQGLKLSFGPGMDGRLWAPTGSLGRTPVRCSESESLLRSWLRAGRPGLEGKEGRVRAIHLPCSEASAEPWQNDLAMEEKRDGR